jgi:hypothetical protein
MKLPDWLIRTIKTFVQSFLGVLIPELCIILNGGFPSDVSAFWKILSPIVAAALSAAICAAWNIINERLKEKED